MGRADREGGRADFLGTRELPFLGQEGVDPDGSYCILFDELRDASLPVQRIVKQAFNERRIGRLGFPPDTLMLAASNGLEHGCMSEALTMSVANRLMTVRVAPDLSEFITWLSGNGDMPEVVAFLSTNPTASYNICGKTRDAPACDGESNFSTHRTPYELGLRINAEWLDVDERGERSLSRASGDPLMHVKLAGILGREAAVLFEEWVKIYESIGSIEALLADPDNAPMPTGPDAMSRKWIIACKLVGVCDEERVGAVLRVAERMNPASQGRGFFKKFIAQSVATTNSSMLNHPELVRFRDENAAVLLGR